MKIELVDSRILDSEYPEFKIPEYATAGSAGIDLQACIDKEIAICSGETVMVDLGIRVDMTSCQNMAALLMIRSSLGKKGLMLANSVGLIDTDYLGKVMAMIKNTGPDWYVLKPADRIAQLMFVPYMKPEVIYGKIDVDKTSRGEGGFGSTGT